MEYKTIHVESEHKFDQKSNELSKQGWKPVFGMVVTYMGGEVYFTQQWYKSSI